MITSLGRPSATSRRVIAILIAVVLALLLLAPSAWACSGGHDRAAASRPMTNMDHGQEGGMPDCGGHDDSRPETPGCGDLGSPGCPASHDGACAAMAGCSVAAFVLLEVPTALDSRLTQQAAPNPSPQQLTRATAPELPPPRA